MTVLNRLYDRSRVVQDWKCPRSRFWGYEYKGRGVRKSSTSLELFTGITVHDSLAAIALTHPNVDIDHIASTAFLSMRESLSQANEGEIGALEFASEQASLTEGMIRGFYRYVWPRLLAQYPIIKYIEQEVEYKHDGLLFMSKPDLIMEDINGEWHYLEYKTTSSKKSEWIEAWTTAVQLHSSIKAVEQTLGKAPIDVTIVGLYKGYQSYGKQSSPFCYAYKRNGNPPFTKDEIQYEYKAGFKRYPTWELEGGVRSWVEGMPDEVLGDLFPMTPPIFVNDDLVTSFFEQRKFREHEIKHFHEQNDVHPELAENHLNVIFPQKWDQCIPYFGRKCEFLRLCHSRTEDPLNEGYVWRDPHHDAERLKFDKE